MSDVPCMAPWRLSLRRSSRSSSPHHLRQVRPLCCYCQTAAKFHADRSPASAGQPAAGGFLWSIFPCSVVVCVVWHLFVGSCLFVVGSVVWPFLLLLFRFFLGFGSLRARVLWDTCFTVAHFCDVCGNLCGLRSAETLFFLYS